MQIKNNSSLLYWGGILLVMMLPIVFIRDNIGMYFDSVFPDYIATQILDPQSRQERWFVAFPYLCQLYHGAIGMWISAFGILLTGTTSVLQHHVTNLILEFMALLLLDKVLSNNNVSILLRRGIIIMLAISPTVSTIAMTQYYIELPGIIFILVSVLVYEAANNTSKDTKQVILLFLSFFIVGIAFYSYFNYLFFTFGFAVLFMLDKRMKLKTGIKLLLVGYGSLAGAVFYIAGYAQLINEKILYLDNVWFPISIWGIVWLICFTMLFLIIKNKVKSLYICTGFILLFVLIILALGAEFIKNATSSLEVKGFYSANLWERFIIVVRYFYFAMTGISAEELVLQERVTSGWILLIYCWSAIIIIYLVLAFINREIINKTTAYMLVGIMYLLCSLPLATRMQTQHFIPLVFWTVIIWGMAMQYIIDTIKNKPYKKYYLFSAFALTLVIIISNIILLVNRYRVIDRIHETGGRGYYTNQVNNLAKEALHNQKLGENEIYIFPEWGFMAEFDYLTGNDIAYTTDCRSEVIVDLLNCGYEVNIVYWHDDIGENAASYAEMVKNIEADKSVIDYYDYDGKIVFSNLEISIK